VYLMQKGLPTTEVSTLVEETKVKKLGKPKHKLKYLGLIWLLLISILALMPFLIVHYVTSSEEAKIYTSTETVPAEPVALVLGAGVTVENTPGWMLADRLDAGIKLYKTGKVQSILMSGGEAEVTIMRQYALQHGIPSTAIITDKAGLRTYDSCYRAARDLKISSAIVVTQEYHLPRSLYLCNSLGINAVGLKAGGDNYGEDGWNHFREFFAQIEAWSDVNVSQPKPKGDTANLAATNR
jgi:vancomycin permeability regulator SanA